VLRAQRASAVSTVSDTIIAEAGGPAAARLLFTGKIRGVRSRVAATAQSVGEVVIAALAPEEAETEAERGGEWAEVSVPFRNENLAVFGRKNGKEGEKEVVLGMVPDLIVVYDAATGEAVGSQEYRYGLKVGVLLMAPHPVWTTPRGLELGGPAAFGLEGEYVSSLEYAKPRSVIEEFRRKE
jgi:DUF917 family protein